MDREHFVALIEEKADSLYRVAFAILGNNADVADALQETALAAWQHLHQLRRAEFFGTWVTRICINISRRMVRRRKPSLPLEELAHLSSPPPDMTLALALHALPEQLRLPLTLQHAEAMSYEEIARVLNIPLSTVRGRISRAKQQLRKELDAP